MPEVGPRNGATLDSRSVYFTKNSPESQSIRGRMTLVSSHSLLDEWKLFFTMVNALWKHRDRLGEPEFARWRAHLELWLDRFLGADRTRPGDVS
jgi:hypothetical protein